ncbi:MAG: NAD(P)-dependent oxidoreductase [Steroidobacteraceae bacterium]
MKVLVTGATGFFGSAIVQGLRAVGHDVEGAARRPDGVHAAIMLDITDAGACRRVMEAGRYEAVVHSAALAHVRPGKVDAAQCLAVNADGADNVASSASASDVRQHVFISSAMVYGDFALPDVVTEKSPRLATGIYGRAKIAAEDASLRHAGAMNVTVLRMASMYAPDWLLNVRKRVASPVLGRWFHFSLDPDTPRYSLCSRASGVETVLRALQGQLPASTYNVADEHVYTQHEIHEAVIRIEGARLSLPIPIWLPRAMLKLADAILRDPESAHSRYWKFCERNVYSSAALASTGSSLPADLLAFGRAHA